MLIPRLKAKLRQDQLLEGLIRGAGSSFGLRVVGFFLGFLAQLVTARFMSDTSFGYFWYAATWATTLALFGTVGYDTATVRFVPAYVGRAEWKKLRGFLHHRDRTVTGLSMALSALLALSVVALRNQLAPDLRLAFYLACLVAPLAAAARVLEGSLRAVKQVRRAQIPLSVIRPGALVCLVLLIAALGLEVDAGLVMAANVTAFLLAVAALAWWWRRGRHPQADSSEQDTSDVPEWRSTARTMMLVSGFTLILFQADILLTGLLIGTSESGRYIVASKIASLLVFVLTAINFIAGPMISDSYSRGLSQDVQRIVTLAVRGSALVSALLAVILLLVGRPLLGMFGTEFVSAYPVLVLLIIGQLVNAFSGPVSLLLNMTGHHSQVAWALGVGATMNLVLNLSLIPLWGSSGAALATAITNASVNLWLVIVVRHSLGVRTLTRLLPRRWP